MIPNLMSAFPMQGRQQACPKARWTVLFVWCSLLCLHNPLQAAPFRGDKDSLKIGQPVTIGTPTKALPVVDNQAMYRTFPELEQYLSANHLSEPTLLQQGYAAPEFTRSYIESMFPVPTAIADSRGLAQATMTEVDRKNNYTDFLSPADLVDLPVGMKKKLGNSSVTIGVSTAKFYAAYTELTVFCKIDLPQGKSIFFGANNVKLSKSGGLIGAANLVLLGDFQIPINGGNSMITLKGGMDMATGAVTNLTYAKLQCGGVKEVALAADITFPRSLLVPLKPDYSENTDTSVRVKGAFGVIVKDWNDILANVSLQPFALKGLEQVAFELKNAVIDLSDTRNDQLVVFPQGYGNLVTGNEGLWRGVYIREVSVILPKEFKKRGTANRVSFKGEKLLIDNWGFTGLVSAINIMQDGTASGWDFSVDKFTIEVQSNRLRSAGFQGAIAIPVSKPKSATDTVAQYGLGYQAIFSANKGYLMSVFVKDSLSFDIWQAKVKIQPGSFIDLVVKDNKFRPRAVLSGTMNLSVMETKDSIASFKGIVFQNMQLQTEAPYFQTQYFGYQSQSKMAKFPITISELSLSTNTSTNEISLIAGVQLNLMEANDNKFSAGTKIRIVGQMTPSEERFAFDYKRLEVEQITVTATFKDAFKVNGFVNFFRNHPLMGNGFSGGLDLQFFDSTKAGVKAMAAFGCKDFRYWYVDVLATGLNMPVGPGFVITGLGGGASYKMKKNTTTIDPSVCPSGIGYNPDVNTGLSLRAMAKFNVGSKNVAVGDAALEMVFTTSGGLARIGLHGKADIMPPSEITGMLGNLIEQKNKLQRNLTKLTGSINSDLEGYITKLNEGKFKDLAKGYSSAAIEPAPNNVTGSIVATLAIEYDFKSKVLDGNFEVFANLSNGVIRGSGANDLAGWAKIRFAPDKWYIHMGTPSNQLGVRIAVGPAVMNTGTYFMVGDSLEGSPPPPAIVASMLGTKLQTLDYMRNMNDLATGRGFAFGSNLNLNTGDMNWLLFYARFQAGIGFDIMVRDYGDKRCAGYSDPVGMNGWYANGQAYAYLQGELGIKVRLLFVSKDIPIVKAGAAMLMQSKLPKPSWFAGYMAGSYNVLGGTIKGSFSCKVAFGDNCELVNTGASTSSQFDFITDFVPTNNEEDVDIMSVPQAVFRLPVDAPFMFDTDANGNPLMFGARLDQFTVTNNGVPVVGQLNWNTKKETVFFESNEILPANATLKAVVKISFYSVVNGYWQPAYKYEQKEITFKTGAAPNGIPLTNIAYSYPAIKQKYFFPREYNQGFVKLKRGQAYLLNAGSSLSAVLTDGNGAKQTVPCTYNVDTREMRYTLPTLNNSQAFSVDFVSNVPINTAVNYADAGVSMMTSSTNLGDGASLSVSSNLSAGLMTRAAPSGTITKLLNYSFATSQHATFVEKMQSKATMYDYTNDIGLGGAAPALVKYVWWSEPFDATELKGTRYTDLKPLIQPEAILADNYYNYSINPVIYQWLGQEGFNITRETPDLGTPPVKAIDVSPAYMASLETTTPDFWSGYTLVTMFPYRYMLAKYYNDDYKQLQDAAISRYGTKTYGCQWYTYYGYGGYNYSYQQCTWRTPYPYYLVNLIEQPFPAMTSGNYRAKFRHVLPNGVETSNCESSFNYYGYY